MNPDLLIPYAVSNVIALLLMWLCWKKPVTGLIAFGIIFILAGIFNFYTASANPLLYQSYADGTIFGFYNRFITGYFRDHTAMIVRFIAAGQMLTGILILIRKGKALLGGILGAIIFLVAIAPLGTGSAFPATLILALAVFIAYKKNISARRGEVM